MRGCKTRWAGALFTLAVMVTATTWLEKLWWPGLSGAAILLYAAGFLMWAPGRLAGRHKPAVVFLAALPLWGVLQLALGTSSIVGLTLRACLGWTVVGAAFWCAAALFNDKYEMRQFLRWTSIFAVVLCAAATLQFFTSEGRYFWIWPSGQPQVFGPFQSKNNYASFVLLTLPLVLWNAVEKARIDWVWVLPGALMLASAIASGSRAGSLLAVLEAAAFLWLARRRTGLSKQQTIALVLGTAGMAMAATLVMGWDALGPKLRDTDPMRYRREMLLSALQMLKDKPLFGHGLGTFPGVYPAYALFDSGYFVNHAHNDWAEWASEGGVPFLVLILGFGACTLPGSIRLPWAIGLPAVFLHTFVDYPLQRPGVSLWVVFLAAAAMRKKGDYRASPLGGEAGRSEPSGLGFGKGLRGSISSRVAAL
ncbi:MAG: O-antigen ligase family protein [Bryobacterales bacterium]|nr:O-antigen ligase family protein [Bryobacterales bacterium]